MHPRYAFLLLPFTRAEVPKWPRLIDSACAGWDRGFRDRWPKFSNVVVRGKRHGFLMNLDLSNWSQRLTFFLGRYYELGTLCVLDLLLKPGDRFVDVGANIGMITLHARSIVGASGRIDCFEPNPDCAMAIRQHLAINAIENVVVHQCALAESAGSLMLNLTSDHSGTATLADVGSNAIRKIPVELRVGDEVLEDVPRLIKIDVEGFELQVLRGLRSTISTARPFVVIELIEGQLALAGTSVGETSEFLFALDYEAFGIRTRRSVLRHQLVLCPIARGGDFAGFADVLWVHRDRLWELPAIASNHP